MYQILYDNAAPPLKEFISLGSETTARAKRRTTFGNNAFSCVAARQWNMLPVELIKVTNFYTFSRLQKWLLSNPICTQTCDQCLCI